MYVLSSCIFHWYYLVHIFTVIPLAYQLMLGLLFCAYQPFPKDFMSSSARTLGLRSTDTNGQ